MSLLALLATRLKRSFQLYSITLSVQNGDTALILAAIYGHTEIVRELLSSGANVDQVAKVNDIFMHDNYEHLKRICHTHYTVH